MADAQMHQTIQQLVSEEHKLWDGKAAGTATDAERRPALTRGLEEGASYANAHLADWAASAASPEHTLQRRSLRP